MDSRNRRNVGTPDKAARGGLLDDWLYAFRGFIPFRLCLVSRRRVFL